MRNLKLTLSYDGTDFFGWQTQPDMRTVQQTLEKAIAKLTCQERVHVNASGRTDAGVHAVAQVANVFSPTTIPADKLTGAINAHLPDDVAVLTVEDMPLAFDANRDAVRKLYRYVIHDGPVASPFLRRYACHHKRRLDDRAMAFDHAANVEVQDARKTAQIFLRPGDQIIRGVRLARLGPENDDV